MATQWRITGELRASASDPAIEILLIGGDAVRVPPGVAREDLERVLGVLLGVVAAEER